MMDNLTHITYEIDVMDNFNMYYMYEVNIMDNFRHGAEEIGGEGSQSQAPGGSRFAFRGAGYKLGETEDDPVSMVQGKPMETEKRQVIKGNNHGQLN